MTTCPNCKQLYMHIRFPQSFVEDDLCCACNKFEWYDDSIAEDQQPPYEESK